MTAVAGTPFTAAQWNIHIRDNLNHCAPAIATTAARWIATTGFNSLAERAPMAELFATSDTMTDTSYGDLDRVGPSVAVTSGVRAIVSIGGSISNSTAGWGGRIAVGVTGAATFEPIDGNSFYVESGNVSDAFKGTWTTVFDSGMAAGDLVFCCKYRAVGGATASFSDRLIAVIPF